MSFDIGIDFRDTAGYVTDPAGYTYCLAELYPTVRGGATFGWVTAIAGKTRDRSTTVDPRLAGIAFQGNTTTKATFRVDLPATGAVDIYCAMGDMGGANGTYLEIFDNTTSLGVIVADGGPGVVPVGSFKDATNTTYTAANWPASNAKATKTFTTTTCIIAITPGTNTGNNYVIASLRLVQSGVTPPVNLLAAPLTQVSPLAVPSITQLQQLAIASMMQVSPFPGEAITISSGTVNLSAAPLVQPSQLGGPRLSSLNNSLTDLKIVR